MFITPRFNTTTTKIVKLTTEKKKSFKNPSPHILFYPTQQITRILYTH